ncbi:Uncharacterized protein dnm_062680 [Desulfonema magnum]|uniref:Uncharacterized protein n=1 Tax=Desulfonema magnum TaxID=45655 RepID=A0A975GQT5_9BACT|nr:Uncharacterized protein dnm_062680 [Desulfonema magnum]
MILTKCHFFSVYRIKNENSLTLLSVKKEYCVRRDPDKAKPETGTPPVCVEYNIALTAKGDKGYRE